MVRFRRIADCRYGPWDASSAPAGVNAVLVASFVCSPCCPPTSQVACTLHILDPKLYVPQSNQLLSSTIASPFYRLLGCAQSFPKTAFRPHLRDELEITVSSRSPFAITFVKDSPQAPDLSLKAFGRCIVNGWLSSGC